MCLAIPGKISSLEEYDGSRVGLVDFDGLHKEINLTLVPEAHIGDYVLVHVGVAIAQVDETVAQETIQQIQKWEGQ